MTSSLTTTIPGLLGTVTIHLAPAPEGTDLNTLRAHFGHDDAVDGCDWCEVRPMLGDLRAVWEGERAADKFDLIWSMQDGYGEPGTMPAQGYDWSGIRDSTPATIKAMWYAAFGAEG